VNLPSGRLKRYVNIAQMEKWGRQWKLIKLSPHKRRC
jgi:hypothetical protein